MTAPNKNTIYNINIVVALVIERPGLTVREIAAAVDLTYNHTRSIVDKAHDAKRVTFKQDGHQRRIYPR